MQTRINWVLMGCAAAALAVTGYREMTRAPQAHVVDAAGCTPEAIKRIDNITERAIQSSQCAQRAR